EPIALQLGMPSLVGGTIGMKLANVVAHLGNAGSNLVGSGWLRRPNLFPQQFLIDQTIKGRVALGGSERVWIAAIREGLEGHFLLPIALQNDVVINLGNHTINDLTSHGGERQGHAERHRGRTLLSELD